MIFNNKSPFIFKELKGTSWYKRFIAEEYYIILDNFPERAIIEDSELNKIQKEDPGFQLYKKQITELFMESNNELDECTYWDILILLRKIKARIFPEIVNKLQIQSSTQVTKGKGSTKKWVQVGLKDHFKNSKKILFIPGKPQNFESDLKLWLKPFLGKKEIEILTFNDPLFRSVSKEFATEVISKMKIDRVKLLTIEDDLINITNLQKMVLDGSLIYTTNIWVFLAIFKSVSPIAFSLNNSEWCCRTLFKTAYNYADNNSVLEKGKYTNILIKTESNNILTITGLMSKTFNEKIDITGTQHCSTNLIDYITDKSPMSFKDRIFENKQWFSELKKSKDTEYISDFYKIDGGKSIICEIGDTNAVHISSIMIDESFAEIEPLFFDSMTSTDELDIDGTGFLTCFNYHFTSNLVKVYNTDVPVEQRLNIENFLIDYIGIFNDKGNFESLPLYNKAFLGCTKKGSLFSGHYGLEEVQLTVGDQIFLYPKDNINANEPYGLFLPGYNEEIVGYGENCLVFIQDQIIYHGIGPCRIPPTGAVVVSKKAMEYNTTTVSISTRFRDLSVKKEEIKWMIGGFNLLVRDGINYYDSIENSNKSLKREGWFLPQSKQTQETQLAPEIKQPRSVFGKTINNKLIIAVFSGRTELSHGATFSESILHVNSLLNKDDKLDFLINFDGGASASLIAYNKGKYRNIGLTAPSAGNPAGTPRQLNAYFSLKLTK